MPLHVTFRVGEADYVVPADQVLHLETYEAATPIPGSPPYVAGIVQVRGRIVPVVDLRRRFALPPLEHSIDRRVIVVQAGARGVGRLAARAREVLPVEAAAFERPPELIEAQSAGFVKAVATIAKRLFLLVDVSRVIGEELSHG